MYRCTCINICFSLKNVNHLPKIYLQHAILFLILIDITISKNIGKVSHLSDSKSLPLSATFSTPHLSRYGVFLMNKVSFYIISTQTPVSYREIKNRKIGKIEKSLYTVSLSNGNIVENDNHYIQKKGCTYVSK